MAQIKLHKNSTSVVSPLYLPLSGNSSVSGIVDFIDELTLSGERPFTHDQLQSINAGSKCEGFTNLGENKIEVGGVSAHVYHTNNYTGYIYSHHGISVGAGLTAELVAETTNYLVAGWDITTQSPTAFVTTNVDVINESNFAPTLTLFPHNNHIYQLSWDKLCLGLPNRLHRRFVKTQRFARQSGLELTTTETPFEFNISQGILWYGAMDETLNNFNSVSNSAFLIYHSSGEWVEETVTGFNNWYYDDGDNRIEVSNNKFAVNWIYRSVSNGDAHILLGTGNYKLDDALDSQPQPNLPPEVSQFSILVGRIIIKKGVDTETRVDSAFNVLFAPATITEHDQLAGLLNNDHPQYSLSGHSHNEFDLFDNYVPASGGTFTGEIYGTFNGDGSSLTSLDWNNISSTSHGHTWDEISNTAHDHTWSEISNTGHTHTWDEISNTAHTHEQFELFDNYVPASGGSFTDTVQFTTLSASESVSATIYYGDGSQLTGIAAGGGDYLPLSGGTVTGESYFTDGLSANSMSAGVYYGDGSQLTGIAGGGGGDFLPLSGGTVTGESYFTNGLSANSISGVFIGDGSQLTGLTGNELIYTQLGANSSQNLGGANGTTVAIEWDDQVYYDTESFTHSTTVNPSRIQCDFTGRVLVIACVGAENTGANRVSLEGLYTVNGSAQTFSTRNYSRGSGYGDLTLNWMFEQSVTSGDYIELLSTVDDADQTSAVNTNTDEMQLYIRRIDVGIKGERGDDGLPGAAGDISWQGEWSAGSYAKNDAVQYSGSAFVANTSTTQTPPDTDWDLLASKGDKGDTGAAGAMTYQLIPIWAEENSSLATASHQWAFGNGANTPLGSGCTVFVPTGWGCSAVAMSLTIGGGTATVELDLDGTLQGSAADVSVATGTKATNEFATPLAITNGQSVNFRTTTASDTSGPCVACVWLRMEPIS